MKKKLNLSDDELSGCEIYKGVRPMHEVYSHKDFGNDLRSELKRGYDVKRLSDWAHKVYLQRSREFEQGLQQIVMQLIAMEEGPEFQSSQKELEELVAKLTSQ